MTLWDELMKVERVGGGQTKYPIGGEREKSTNE